MVEIVIVLFKFSTLLHEGTYFTVTITSRTTALRELKLHFVSFVMVNRYFAIPWYIQQEFLPGKSLI